MKWRDSDTSRLLWVSAGPGCGKSVLARALIDERRVCTDTTDPTICYFFFKDGQEQRTRGANALSALLHQLFENTTLITHALPTFRRYGRKLRDEFTELWEVLIKSAADPQAGDIICVLDALDECEENARNQLIGKLIYFFSEAVYQHPSLKLKFLVTSRPYDDLELKFERLSTFSTYMRFDGDEKSWMIGQEINLVIDAKIPHIAGRFDHEDRRRICDRLKDMENRTYLWLFLTIDIIEKAPSNFRRKSDLDSLLSNLPAEVSEAYDRILQRSTDETKARILLELIVAATRPLSLEEANIALTIATREDSCTSQKGLDLWPSEIFGTTVRSWCGLFVNVHDEKLSLIHQTAREFLTKTSNSTRGSSYKWKGCLDVAAAHGTISRICLDYLQLPDVASIREYDRRKLMKEYRFLGYAARHWASHYSSQPAEFARASLNAAMNLCGTSSTRGWFLVYRTAKGLNLSRWTNLGIASHLGLVNVAEELLNKGANGNAKCSPFGNALVTASMIGHDQMVQMLLDNGADVNAQAGIRGNALQAASLVGHDQIVQILLDKGADVNAQGGHYGNALQAASYTDCDQIVRILLDKGADVNAQGGEYGNALQAASVVGYDQIVRMLLDKGADVNAQGGLYGSALQAASAEGKDQVVQMLLDNEAVDIDGKALKTASKYGQAYIVRILLDRWREYYIQHIDILISAMRIASERGTRGFEKVVQILLDIEATDIDSEALKAALIYYSRGYIVRILLDRQREYYI